MFTADIAGERDFNVIAGLLKLYFRELAEPLFVDELYEGFIEAASKFRVPGTGCGHAGPLVTMVHCMNPAHHPSDPCSLWQKSQTGQNGSRR